MKRYRDNQKNDIQLIVMSVGETTYDVVELTRLSKAVKENGTESEAELEYQSSVLAKNRGSDDERVV